MNTNIIKEISLNLKIKEHQVETTLKLLEDKNTIPFIARYRKEATGNLDEDQIRSINEVYEYQVNLLKRKEDVIRLIDEKEMLTDELQKEIMKSTKLVEVEDLYRPFKEKKKTKATEAIALGLEPLAKLILTFPIEGTLEDISKPYLNDKVKTTIDALAGAGYIISELISDDANYRKWIRNFTFNTGVLVSSTIFFLTFDTNTGVLVSKVKKNIVDEYKTYEMYYDYKEKVKDIKPHRILALNRGEKEKIITINIDLEKEKIHSYLEANVIKNENSFVAPKVKEAIVDSYKRLISPSIEREIRSEMTEFASEKAIEVFGKNLEKLLLQPPMKDKIVLGFDPAFRTGCKLAVVDETGKMVDVSVIYPHEPKNEIEKSKKQVLNLIEKFNIDIIAIGNGTASRESEAFIVDVIKESSKKVEYIIVNEAGASVYSASKKAQAEFPDLHVEERSAISIGRRLQDPLSELVKIDTKSIGVGQYQHDVAEKKLDESLEFVVTRAVNSVGVNINTASDSLLKFVSGMTKSAIDNIMKYRDKKGKILNKDEIKKILTPKTYEQSVGFVRILDGTNPLDKTGIHPESYTVTKQLLESLELTVDDIGSEQLINKLSKIYIDEYIIKLGTDKYTLEDIIKSLQQPTRDPRDEFTRPLLKSDILQIEDLKVGMKLQGTVRNVVDFGVFIDIGLKNDALAHISKLTNRYIKHPLEVVNVGDIVDCYVDEIHEQKKKVSLSLLNFKEE